jgi:hypothetical protein
MSNDLILQPQTEIAQRFMPVFTPKAALQRYQVMKDFITEVMRDGVDFGGIPGTGEKPTLLNPGAEKLCTLFGLVPDYTYEAVIENWGDDGKEPLFFYRIKCKLFQSDFKAGEGIGAATSRESKHRWRWVDEASAKRMGIDIAHAVTKGGTISEPVFAIEKAETSGKYGKPAAYWDNWKKAIAEGRARKIQKPKKDGGTMDAWEVAAVQYRVPNDNIADVVNTCLKMALKRAQVAAVLTATNASEYFTQDQEDFIDITYTDVTPEPTVQDIKKEAAQVDTGGQPVGTKEAAQAVAERKLADPDWENLSPQAPPPPTARPKIDRKVELDVVLGQLANANNRRGVYETLHKNFVNLIGEGGADKYYEIVAQVGQVSKPGELTSLVAHRQLVTALYTHLQPYLEQAEAAA